MKARPRTSWSRRCGKAGVARVIDVRAVPLSRKPGFSKNVLAAGLKEAGIDYVHLKALGTPPAGREAARKGRHEEMLRIYAAQLETPEAGADAARMVDLAAEKPSALLCFERDPASLPSHPAARSGAAGVGGGRPLRLSGERLRAHDRRQGQHAVDMGKQRAAARFFPAHGVAERFERHFDEDEPRLAGEMARERTFDLIGRRKVDEAVGAVGGRAIEPPVGLEAGPLRRGQDLERGRGEGGHSSGLSPPSARSSPITASSVGRDLGRVIPKVGFGFLLALLDPRGADDMLVLGDVEQAHALACCGR